MFQCEVPMPDMESAWYKEETRLWASAKYLIEEAGAERRLTVLNVSSDDDAVYICETAEGSRTVAELAVQGVWAAGRETGQRVGLLGPGPVTEALGGGAGRIPGHWVRWELWTQGQEGGVGGQASGGRSDQLYPLPPRPCSSAHRRQPPSEAPEEDSCACRGHGHVLCGAGQAGGPRSVAVEPEGSGGWGPGGCHC